MHWRVKGCIQGVLSRLPGGMQVNDLLQSSLGGRIDQEGHVDRKFGEDWLVFTNMLRARDYSARDKVIMEIGTGWLPVLPLCFALAGARRVHSYDLYRHLLPDTAPAVLERLGAHLQQLARAAGESIADVMSRHAFLSAASDAAGILQRAGFDYHAPVDAIRTDRPAASIDFVFSNSVLEHVAQSHVTALMAESNRVLKPGGWMLHSVNCGDHYAYFDRSITAIHYLRYSSRQWRRWNNRILFQNRLRPLDFVQAVERTGFELTDRAATLRQELLANLASIPIADEFRHYSPEELCTTSVTLMARKIRDAGQETSATHLVAGDPVELSAARTT
jgi:SAM-dependent methyltransferase